MKTLQTATCHVSFSCSKTDLEIARADLGPNYLRGKVITGSAPAMYTFPVSYTAKGANRDDINRKVQQIVESRRFRNFRFVVSSAHTERL